MCGIAGIINLDEGRPERSRVEKMVSTIVHRGPDDVGMFEEGPLCMGMRRLSIIDLSTGRQPISSEDGAVTVVFNGEIYNYRQLRDELEKSGHKFSTNADTEAIVHLYEERGEDFVLHLNGMFAIALWDYRKQKLIIARDRLGIKPLYYTQSGGELVFGSEIKCLEAAGVLRREPDTEAIDWYLAVQYFPLERTIYKDARKLMPGHMLIVENGGARTKKFWDIYFPAQKEPVTEAEAVDRFRDLLCEAVKKRLMSDVPLGAFLSGGIDSSAVCAVMSGMMNEPVKTFSLGFGREEKDFNELPYAVKVGRHFGVDSHSWVVRPDEVSERMDRIMEHFDEPFGGGLHTYFVSEMAAKEVKVALSGIGADEMLGGYERQKKARLLPLYSKLPGAAKSMLKAGASALGRVGAARDTADKVLKLDRLSTATQRQIYFEWIAVFDGEMKQKLYTPQFMKTSREATISDYVFSVFGDNVPEDFNDMISYLELKTTLPDDFLNYTDRMSMAWSLEARTPFLDHTLVEYAATLPMDLKLKDGSTKYLLKKAMEGLLPEEIINRKKQPFFMPLGLWFRGGLRPLVEGSLLKEKLHCGELLKTGAVRETVQDHLEGRADHTWRIWSMLLLEKWFEKKMV